MNSIRLSCDCYNYSFQQKGVRIVSVAIGKKAYKKKFKAILQKIAGENILYVDDYPSLENFVGDIQSRVCRKYLLDQCEYPII